MWDGQLQQLVLFVGVIWGNSGCIHVVDASLYVNSLFQEYEFHSVQYFDLLETKWPYFDQVLSGRVAVLPSLDLDQIFARDDSTDDEVLNRTAQDIEQFFDENFNDDYQLEVWKESPKFLIVNFGPSSEFDEYMQNTTLAAEKLNVDFVVLVVSSEATWKEKFSFWWSHQFPGCPTKEILPIMGNNATHPHFFMAIGDLQGKEIIELIERETRFFGNYSVEGFYFGMDGIDCIKGKDFLVQLMCYLFMVFWVSRWIGNEGGNNSQSPTPSSSSSHHGNYTRFTGDDLGLGEIQSSSSTLQDCPVCLETMHPGETVRILPCRHILHHDCITGWLRHSYTCPLCKFDLCTHLEEQRNASQDIVRVARRRRFAWRLWPFGRRIENDSGVEDQLIIISSGTTTEPGLHGASSDDVGDLELTEEPRTIV